jgi:hypothetical protein
MARWSGAVRWFVLAAAWAGAGIARADAAESPAWNVDVGFASAYNWRGVNVFGDRQGDQHAFVAPGISWTFAPGLTLGYWGAYQVTGERAAQRIDAGVGAENDLSLAYETEVAADTTVTLGLGAYAYPFAARAAAGVANPAYLEPRAAIGWSGPVDLGLQVSYFAGLEDALAAYRYLYLQPTLEKAVELAPWAGLELSVGLGYKAFAERYATATNGNRVDVAASVALPIALGERYYVKPAASAAWTDLDRTAFGDEAFVFGAVNVGANL